MAYGEAVVGICLLFQLGVNFLSCLMGSLFSFSNSSLGGWGVQHVGMFCLWPLTPFSHPAFDIPPQCTVTQLFCIEIEAKLELVDQQQFPPPIQLSGIFSFPRIKPLAKMGRPMWKTRNRHCVLTSSPCVNKKLDLKQTEKGQLLVRMLLSHLFVFPWISCWCRWRPVKNLKRTCTIVKGLEWFEQHVWTKMHCSTG